jgi:hypothetical protein
MVRRRKRTYHDGYKKTRIKTKSQPSHVITRSRLAGGSSYRHLAQRHALAPAPLNLVAHPLHLAFVPRKGGNRDPCALLVIGPAVRGSGGWSARVVGDDRRCGLHNDSVRSEVLGQLHKARRGPSSNKLLEVAACIAVEEGIDPLVGIATGGQAGVAALVREFHDELKLQR